jgi:cell division protein FtsA
LARKGEIVGAIDFGSRCIRILIARKGKDGDIQIIGHGTAPSRGCVSQGIVQDLSAAQLALKRALTAAEKEAGVKIPSLFCGINGKNVETYLREGQVKLDKEMVELPHLEEALDQAARDILAPGKRIISSISSQEWYVDDLRVVDPIHIRGTILKTRVHFAQLPSVIEENLVTCIESQGRELEDVVFLPLCAAMGCLTPEDMELGVGVLDMGRSTTSIAIYRDRRILGTHSFEWGGFHITRDVAAGLQVSFEEAAELVMEYGLSDELIRRHDEDDEDSKSKLSLEPESRSAHIKLKSAVRGAPSIVERAELDMITYERSRELMAKVQQYLKSQGLEKHLVRGIVITGGAAAIGNQAALAEAVFQVPARVGLPVGIDVLPQAVNAPDFVPVAGVIRHAFDYRTAARSGRIETNQGFTSRFFRGIIGFFSKYFF